MARGRWGRGRLGRVLVGVTAALIVAATACASDGSSGGAASGKSDADRSSTTTTAAPLARYAGYTSEVYADPVHWVCRPGADDVCSKGDLDATVVEADGTLTPEPWKQDPDAPIDCFYVYPTVSTDAGDFSDLEPGEAERYVTLNQAARLGSQCRVFAPVYRQRTLAGLGRSLGGSAGAATPGVDPDQPYRDVLDAWKQYMAHDNGGRGVVLIGHSQGAGMLTRLVAEEIDPNDDVRDHLVAAYIAGMSVSVPAGADVGGSFQHVKVCRAEDQTGCVVSWASFRASSPPSAGAFFGKPGGQGMVAVCANPAAITGGSAELHSYFPSSPASSFMSSVGAGDDTPQPWVDPSTGTIDTPFVTTPGLVSAECASRDGYTYLAVTTHPDPAGPRRDDMGGDMTPTWGLHLQDVNLVMGDIVTLVGSQSEAWRDAND